MKKKNKEESAIIRDLREYLNDPQRIASANKELGELFRSEGRKDDEQKLRYDLLSPIALEELVKVYTQGAEVYGDRNWEQGIKYSRIFAAIMRHLWAWYTGENLDKKSGLNHCAHAAWGCFTLIHYQFKRKEFDDRKREGD